MRNNQETNSGAHGGAETTIHISRSDLNWIKQTKVDKTVKDRLHEVITLFRKQTGEKI